MQNPFNCEVTVTNQKGLQELQEWDAQPKRGQPIWPNVPQKYMQAGKHFSRMHINRAASRLSSDRVVMRPIVNRMTHASESITFPCGR